MAFFKYTGDRDSTRVYGVTFTKGRAAEMPDDAFAKKLRGNPEFVECEAADPVDHEPPASPPPEPVDVVTAPAGDPTDDPSDDEPPPPRRKKR